MSARTKITVDEALYEEAKTLDAHLAAREGRLTNVSNYVRRAITELNRKTRAELGVSAPPCGADYVERALTQRADQTEPGRADG